MSVFGSKRPKLPAIKEPVTDDTQAVKEAAQREAESLRKRKGRASTILTGARGVMTDPSIYKTILG